MTSEKENTVRVTPTRVRSVAREHSLSAFVHSEK